MNRAAVFAAAKAAGADFNKPGMIDIMDDACDRLGIARAAPVGERLGDLSMRYETGHKPGEETAAAGKVSSGKGDPGGKSYGAYQLASLKGQVAKFLAAEGAPWAAELNGMDPTKPGPFEQRWKAIAARDGAAFFAAQHAYIERTHYRPVAAHAQAIGLAVDAMPKAVRDALWSMAVQHAGARKIVSDALAKGGVAEDPRAVINALYDARLNYVRGIKLPAFTLESLIKRYASERADALRMIGGAA